MKELFYNNLTCQARGGSNIKKHKIKVLFLGKLVRDNFWE